MKVTLRTKAGHYYYLSRLYYLLCRREPRRKRQCPKLRTSGTPQMRCEAVPRRPTLPRGGPRRPRPWGPARPTGAQAKARCRDVKHATSMTHQSSMRRSPIRSEPDPAADVVSTDLGARQGCALGATFSLTSCCSRCKASSGTCLVESSSANPATFAARLFAAPAAPIPRRQQAADSGQRSCASARFEGGGRR